MNKVKPAGLLLFPQIVWITRCSRFCSPDVRLIRLSNLDLNPVMLPLRQVGKELCLRGALFLCVSLSIRAGENAPGFAPACRVRSRVCGLGATGEGRGSRFACVLSGSTTKHLLSSGSLTRFRKQAARNRASGSPRVQPPVG